MRRSIYASDIYTVVNQIGTASVTRVHVAEHSEIESLLAWLLTLCILFVLALLIYVCYRVFKSRHHRCTREANFNVSTKIYITNLEANIILVSVFANVLLRSGTL